MTIEENRPHRQADHVIAALMGDHMLITDEGREKLIEIASRENVITPEVLAKITARSEVVAAKTAAKMDGADITTKRDGIAIIDVNGPIMRYPDLFMQISGGVSVSSMATDFNAALNDPTVTGILFRLDSPGGEAKGVNEFANMIYDARGRKPIGAYAETAGSGCYWIGSAVDPGLLWIDAIGFAGSIGAVTEARKNSPNPARVTVVSSVSPKKRIDVGTEAGLAVVQNVIDSLGETFVAAVARNRGMTRESVIASEGLMKMGQAAVDAGLVDRVGSFEALLAEMKSMKQDASASTQPGDAQANANQGADMSLWNQIKAALGGGPEDATLATAAEAPAVSVPDEGINVAEIIATNELLAAELAKRKEAEEKLRADVIKERATSIEAAADSFMATAGPDGKSPSDKLGKEAAASMRSRYVAAKTANDDAAVKDLENLAAGISAAGPESRVADKGGPTAEEIAERAKPLTADMVAREAMNRVKATGIRESSPKFKAAYFKEIAAIKAGGANVAA